MQGTNAHVVMEVCTPDSSPTLLSSRRPVHWLRARHWFAPPTHPLLRSAAAAGAQVQLAGPCSLTSTACLGDCGLGSGASSNVPAGLALEVRRLCWLDGRLK